MAVVTSTVVPRKRSGDKVLDAYMDDLRHHPLLTREEEQELAQLHFETGDVRARHRLVNGNLRLVVKLAFEYSGLCDDVSDLIQEGGIGLVQAVQRYDPGRGVRLTSFAQWWIRAYILKFILDNWRIVKVGTTQAQRRIFYNLNKQRERLRASGIEPSNQVLAERMGVSERDVASMGLRLSCGDLSIHSYIAGDEGAQTIEETLAASDDCRPDVALEKHDTTNQLQLRLQAFEDILDARDLSIFRYRILASPRVPLKVVSRAHKITIARVKQIEDRIKDELREFLLAN